MFLGFFGTKTKHKFEKFTTQKHMKNIPYISYKRQISSERRMKNMMWKLKNENEIDESHKSIKIWEWHSFIKLHNKNKKPKLGFWGLSVF